MEQTTPAVRDLARLLLALEADRSEHADAEEHDVLRVFEKLRSSLSKLVGITGFQALLVRALALAKAEVSWLGAVRVKDDATLEGFRETAWEQPEEAATEGSAALLAHVIALLVTFIGKDLTLRLVVNVWPEARWDGMDSRAEETRHE